MVGVRMEFPGLLIVGYWKLIGFWRCFADWKNGYFSTVEWTIN
jgi:hypothetical protein